MKIRKSRFVEGLDCRKVDNNISYQTLKEHSGPARAIESVARRSKHDQIAPISNLASHDTLDTSEDSGVPSKRDFTIYRLKRQIAQLRDAEKCHLAKLSRALAELQSQQRFFEVGLSYDQWESWDELNQRRLHLQGTIDSIRDPLANPVEVLSDEENERLKTSL